MINRILTYSVIGLFLIWFLLYFNQAKTECDLSGGVLVRPVFGFFECVKGTER